MATVTTGAGIDTDGSHEGPSAIFSLIDHLRTNTNWTVAGSGNGTDGYMGFDYISTAADLYDSGAWVVMECPGGGPQILWNRYSATDTNWRISLAPDADFTGGTATTPPTSTHEFEAQATNSIGNGSARFHMTAENGSTVETAGWSVFLHTPGDSSSGRGSMAFCPTTNVYSEDPYPWIFVAGSYNTLHNQLLWNETSTVSAGCKAITHDDALQNVPAMILYGESNLVVPKNMGPSPTGEDVAIPMLHIRGPGFGSNPTWKGINTYACWNGSTRTAIETYNSLTRVSFGDVNFPWDGVNTPTIS